MDEEIIVKRPPGRPRKSPAEKAKTKELAAARKKERELTGTPSKFGQEFVEPGDNSRYLGHAMTIMRMPLVDLNDPEAVRDRCNWYFEHCFNNDMKPTVSGLCNAFKIQRSTLLEWKRGTYRKDTHQAIILEAYAIMETLWEDYMQNGKINPVSGIFLAKNNFGYQDKQEMVLTPNQQNEAVDVATIEAKYAELPEE
jgi:hypothetical protein